MLNLFAATGYISYDKSVRLHLQNMLNLRILIFGFMSEGRLYTVRRSEKFWTGLWTDLIIEQVTMRSIKSSGGLTRGRGITESTRQLWLGSMHRCADIRNVMGELTGVYRNTSEQHVDLSCSWILRDNNDLQTLKDWFDVQDLFDEDEQRLKSLSIGLKGDSAINCEEGEAEEIGRKYKKYWMELKWRKLVLNGKTKCEILTI